MDKKNETPINEQILAENVRLIGADGEQKGIVKTDDALRMAQDVELDLVCVSPMAQPPVCKLMDYQKYRYEQQKHAREARKNQHVIEVKIIQLSPVIGDSDFETKLKAGRKFLESGDKVKVLLKFNRGRARMQNAPDADAMIKKYMEACDDIASVTQPITKEGRDLSAVLSPKTKRKGEN